MYKITETELREINKSLKFALNNIDWFFRTSDKEVESIKRIIKSLEENYNIK